MSFTFLLADDSTPATGLAFGPTWAGDTSATQTLHGWYNKGTAGGSISNLSIQALDPATSLDTGLDWLDETWLEARINGGSNPGNDPAFHLVTTGWTRLGSGTMLLADDLPGNCAYYIELRLRPPLKYGVPTETVNFTLVANYNESVLSLAGALADLGQGIVTGLGDLTVTEFVEAPAVTASGTPDAVVHVAADWYMYAGVSVRKTGTDALTLDQNDSASVALTTGHEYKAVISQPPAGAACVATKGLLAVTGAGVPPAVPAGNLIVAVVNVAYHSSASVINTSDITVYAKDGRGKPTIGTGLTVNVAAFRAILAGSRIINRSATLTNVPASTTRYMWLGSNGAFVGSSTAVPPFVGALPIFSCVAGSSTVTSITDLRVFVGALRAPGRPVYASNAAAIAGGLGPGDMYRTGADPDVLCVVSP